MLVFFVREYVGNTGSCYYVNTHMQGQWFNWLLMRTNRQAHIFKTIEFLRKTLVFNELNMFHGLVT